MTVLIDSWAWIEYFRGTEAGQKAKEVIENKEETITTTINISEVYRYLLANKPEDADKLVKFMIGSSFVISLDVGIALKAAKLKVMHKIGLADAIVLATAEEHKSKIITGDADFKNMKDVIYIGK